MKIHYSGTTTLQIAGPRTRTRYTLKPGQYHYIDSRDLALIQRENIREVE